MAEIHAGECGEHQGWRKLYEQLLTHGYYWPSMKKNAADFVRRCHTCQGYIWILVATEYFTKWVEAVSLRKVTGLATSNFIKEYIICCFGIPYKIVSDNGTPFINQHVRRLLDTYKIEHWKSTPYYPQRNGQAEATNESLLRILSKMVHEYEEGWSVHLQDTLWAHQTSSKAITGFSPYFLVYGYDAILPYEVLVPTAHILVAIELNSDANICGQRRIEDLESIEAL
ncbi:hypothetical protein SLA2020_025610 [Shorea laevis]